MASSIYQSGEILKLEDIVFTAMFGDYETLNEVPEEILSKCKFICFTDSPQLQSQTWNVVQVAPLVPGDSVKSSRAVKMLGHQNFPAGTRSLYVDNTVQLLVDPEIILDEWLRDCSLAYMHHSTRKTVRDEFFVCAVYGLDSFKKIFEQYNYYKQKFPNVLREKPFWGGMIARVTCEDVNKFMNEWFTQYMRFARRDQLAINAASKLSGITISPVDGRNDLNWSHKWPISKNRKVSTRYRNRGVFLRKLLLILNGLRYAPRFYLF